MPNKVIEVFVIVGPYGNLGAWHSTRENGHRVGVECVHAFTSEADAWHFVMGDDPTREHERAMRVAWRVLRVSAPISCDP